MSCSQLVRKKSSTSGISALASASATDTWTSVFPLDVKTEEKSLLFVKKLVAVGISTVTYLRGVFPERAYGDKCCEGLNLKMLVEGSNHDGVNLLIRWISGAFDAIHNKYLRQLTLAFSAAEDPNAATLETYSFKFTYGTDGAASVDSISTTSKSVSGVSTQELRRPTLRMLRSIILLTQSLEGLPSDVFLSMRLLYYDHVTPRNYDPPGFHSTAQAFYTFATQPTRIKVGEVRTGFHSVRLKVHTAQFKGGFDNELPSSQEQDVSSVDDQQSYVQNCCHEESTTLSRYEAGTSAVSMSHNEIVPKENASSGEAAGTETYEEATLCASSLMQSTPLPNIHGTAAEVVEHFLASSSHGVKIRMSQLVSGRQLQRVPGVSCDPGDKPYSGCYEQFGPASLDHVVPLPATQSPGLSGLSSQADRLSLRSNTVPEITKAPSVSSNGAAVPVSCSSGEETDKLMSDTPLFWPSLGVQSAESDRINDAATSGGEAVGEKSGLSLTPVTTHYIQKPSSVGSQCSVHSVRMTSTPGLSSPEYPVRCCCQVAIDDGLMLLCDICGYWQHGACYSILEEKDAPERHVCQSCADPPALCSDPRLCALTPARTTVACLFRRLLSILRTEDMNAGQVLTASSIARRLTCDISHASTLLDRLHELGVFKQLSKRKTRTRSSTEVTKLNKKKLMKEIIPKYFKGVGEEESREQPDFDGHMKEVTTQGCKSAPKRFKASVTSTNVKNERQSD